MPAKRVDTSKGLWRGLILVLALVTLTGACGGSDWRTASREPAGIAPDAARTPGAVLQVYGAPAWGWRGWFAIHTWIATKAPNEAAYTVYEVIGWRLRRGNSALRIEQDFPDRFWFGERPELLLDRQGDGVDDLIARVDAAARAYPWARTYKAWPGPNSNTFTAWVANSVPELGLDLPMRAIGKGWTE